MSHVEHKAQAPASVACFVLTVSDSRTPETDTGGRAIKIDFDTPVDLPVGLTVNANIVVSRIDAALTLPRRAVVTDGTTSHVLMIVDGKATERPVSFADWPADRVVVTDGVAAGDVVILDPTVVKPGQSVRAE